MGTITNVSGRYRVQIRITRGGKSVFSQAQTTKPAAAQQQKLKLQGVWQTRGYSFTRACKLLQIDDLHFHDLRHEGASRLFEMGWSIPQVATVTGHRSWQSLQRYSRLRQTGDKLAGWPVCKELQCND